MALAGVDIHAPLIQENRAAAFFQVRVRPGRGRCRLRPSAQGQDASLLPLQDYGYYAAGVEAKKAYLRLMHFFRTQEGVPTLLLAPPPAWQLEIVGKIYETSSFDCRSSQLALLLGMLACQGHLPVAEVFASGELNNTGDLPRVEAVGGLAEKSNAILEHIELSQPRHLVLIALPRQFAPGKGAVTGNDSAERFARRLQTFRQANPHLSLTVMYCDDVAALFPAAAFIGIGTAVCWGVWHWLRSWLPRLGNSSSRCISTGGRRLLRSTAHCACSVWPTVLCNPVRCAPIRRRASRFLPGATRWCCRCMCRMRAG